MMVLDAGSARNGQSRHTHRNRQRSGGMEEAAGDDLSRWSWVLWKEKKKREKKRKEKRKAKRRKRKRKRDGAGGAAWLGGDWLGAGRGRARATARREDASLRRSPTTYILVSLRPRSTPLILPHTALLRPRPRRCHLLYALFHLFGPSSIVY